MIQICLSEWELGMGTETRYLIGLGANYERPEYR